MGWGWGVRGELQTIAAKAALGHAAYLDLRGITLEAPGQCDAGGTSIGGRVLHLLSQALPHPRQLMLCMALMESGRGTHQGFGVLGPPHRLL